ncbi:MAG: hypothetical protein PHP32_07440 [Candidatus Izemoplasmatales bacterium]|nr:hypothetical protein [Candidatus Izemoplasmatales bacterium]
MKKGLIKTFLIGGVALVGVLAFGLTGVQAESVYAELSDEVIPVDDQVVASFTLEEMLSYAIQDEYLAQAEYAAIIATYGEVRPFINIVAAEQTHIDLLLGLYETYGLNVPENTASDSVIIPESLTAAIATGIDAENANIAMYQAFLAQTDLPDDVKAVFEYLVNASANHLAAFSKDRLYGVGSDLANQIKNMFQYKGSNGSGSGDGTGTGNQYKGSNGKSGSASGNQYKGANGNAGVCINS